MTAHRLTAEELDAAACEWAERTAREQGLPVGIEDPVWLDQLATFMTSPRSLGEQQADDPSFPLRTSAHRESTPAAGAGRGSAPTSPEAA